MAVRSFWIGPMHRSHGRPGEDGGEDTKQDRQATKRQSHSYMSVSISQAWQSRSRRKGETGRPTTRERHRPST